MDLQDVVLSEMSMKDKYCMISFICENLKTNKYKQTKSYNSVKRIRFMVTKSRGKGMGKRVGKSKVSKCTNFGFKINKYYGCNLECEL